MDPSLVVLVNGCNGLSGMGLGLGLEFVFNGMRNMWDGAWGWAIEVVVGTHEIEV